MPLKLENPAARGTTKKVPLKDFSGSAYSDTFFFVSLITKRAFSGTFLGFSDTFCVPLNVILFVVNILICPSRALVPLRNHKLTIKV